MRGSANTSDNVDPYATLDAILKVIKRTWLTEEWRLEDIRLLAQEAMNGRPKRALRESATRTPHVRKSRSEIKHLRITSSEQSLSL